MSFGNRMRAKRSKGGLLLAALVSAVALGATTAPPTAPTSTQGRDSAFVNPAAKAQKKRKKTRVLRSSLGGDGTKVLDGVKARRRYLMILADRPNTGRQWRIVRAIIRRSPIAYLLNTPAGELAALGRTRKLTFRRWQPA